MGFRELYQYRGMIYNLVKRDVRGRYKGSMLGAIWNFIPPFAQILVYVFVFSSIFSIGIKDYSLYLIVGIVPWLFFSETLIDGAGSIVNNSDLVKKIYFPRIVIPISVTLSHGVNFIIYIFFEIIVMIVFGYTLSLSMVLYAIITFILFFILTLTLTCLVAAIDVYFRDMQFIVSVMSRILVWLSPITYTYMHIESNDLLNWIVGCNPITYYIDLFHDVLYWGATVEYNSIMICVTITCIVTIISIIGFIKLEKRFAEVL